MVTVKKILTIIELFLKGANFYRGIKITFAVLVPLITLNFIGYFQFAPAIVIGAFLNAPGDIPGSLKRKVNAILISISLTMLITAIILLLKPYLLLLVMALAVISFVVSFISIYGFRASLVSFSGLLAMVLAFAIENQTTQEIFIHIGLMGVGGFWYLFVSYLFQKIAPKKEENQLLSDVLLLIGNYLKLRAKLLTKKKKRQELIQRAFVLQTQINEKHETLRETLFTGRKRSGRSHYNEKQVLIFISSVNIFELIEAKHLDYEEIDRIFGNHKKYLKASKKLNTEMGNHLIKVSELLIQNDNLPNRDPLLIALSQAHEAITNFINAVKLPQAREGAIVLRNLFDYQEFLLEEIRSIRRVMANVNHASKVSLKRQDAKQFLTLQEYRFNIIIQNLSFSSTIFRHALRFTVAIVLAFVIGTVFNIHNTYWILLTIIVIMRPSYGLTKERSKDRIIGTLIGSIIAIGIVLITPSMIIYGILAIISLTLAFALIQQNYKSGAAFITINIIFVYALMNPNAFEVIQYRIMDTIIGASIAVAATYLLWPRWETNNLKEVFLNAIHYNKVYLLATKDLYHNKNANQLAYKVARKKVFLAISNLNAAFQRLTQDPKSKQKEFQLIYNLVTLNQTMVSAIASIGSFILNHNTTKPSKEFDAVTLKITDNLQKSSDILEGVIQNHFSNNTTINQAQETLLKTYQKLSYLRDEDIQKGNTKLDTNTLHQLQEAYLIANQLIWLKTLSENLKKATERYHLIFIEEKKE